MDLICLRVDFSVFIWGQKQRSCLWDRWDVGQIFNPLRNAELCSIGFLFGPGSFMNQFSQGGLAAKGYCKCQIQITLTLTVIKEVTSVCQNERFSIVVPKISSYFLRKRIISCFLECAENRYKIINNF